MALNTNFVTQMEAVIPSCMIYDNHINEINWQRNQNGSQSKSNEDGNVKW